MKYKPVILLLCVLLIFCFMSRSQNFFLYPSDTFERDYFYGEYDYDGLYIINFKSSPLDLEWMVIDSTFAPGSDYYLCNSGECFVGLPTTGAMTPIDPNDTAFIFLHIWIGDTIGTSTIKIMIYETDTPSNNDTLIFKTHAIGPDTTTFVFLPGKTLQTSIYPTLVKDHLHFEITNYLLLIKMEIINLAGIPISELSINEQSKIIDVSYLKKGIYFLKIYNEDGTDEIHKFIKYD